MQQYTKVAFRSRGLDPDMDTPWCEICGNKYACDVDHIRGRNIKYPNAPKNLILLCRECHTNKKNTFEYRTLMEKIVLQKIKPKDGGDDGQDGVAS